MIMRIVHLISPRTAGDEGVLACAAAMREPGTDQVAILLGNTRDEERALCMGVRATERLGAEGVAYPWLAPRRLRRLLEGYLAGARARSIVQSWCPSTLRMARAAAPEGAHHVGMLLRHPTEGEWAPRRGFDIPIHNATLACYGSDVAAAYSNARRSLSPSWRDRVRVLDTPLLNVQAFAVGRALARTQLGIDEATPVILLLADPAYRADALAFMFRVGLLHTTGRSGVGLVPRGAMQARRVARFVRLNGRRWGFVESDLPLPDLLSAADAAIVDRGPVSAAPAPSCGATALQAAGELGVPVVGARECGPGAHQSSLAALAVHTRSPRAGVSELLRLMEDPDFREGAVRDACAYARRPRSGHTLAHLWRELANVPVENAEHLPYPSDRLLAEAAT